MLLLRLSSLKLDWLAGLVRRNTIVGHVLGHLSLDSYLLFLPILEDREDVKIPVLLYGTSALLNRRLLGA